MFKSGLPEKLGLYHPGAEHDACGVGFLANLAGEGSHALVRQALDILVNLDHCGGCGCEPNTGDGAGILLQLPDRFLRRVCVSLGFRLPPPGQYGVGMVFTSPEPDEREAARAAMEASLGGATSLRSTPPWAPRRATQNRSCASSPFASAPAALRLLQAALRPGDQPAHRPDPRGAHHLDPDASGSRGEPVGADPGERPADPPGASASFRPRPG